MVENSFTEALFGINHAILGKINGSHLKAKVTDSSGVYRLSREKQKVNPFVATADCCREQVLEMHAMYQQVTFSLLSIRIYANHSQVSSG